MDRPQHTSRLFTLGEAYRIVYLAFRTMPALSRARHSGAISKEFTERLMLAVTEVNRCAMCSYAHTRIALEAGLSAQEIAAMLTGNDTGVIAEELPAVLFAQHYAETRGKASPAGWQAVLNRYGSVRSQAILGAIRAIMMGNAYGIPFGNLIARFSRKRGKVLDTRSSVGYELGMLLTLPVFLLFALLQALAAAALRQPIAVF